MVCIRVNGDGLVSVTLEGADAKEGGGFVLEAIKGELERLDRLLRRSKKRFLTAITV